MLLTWFVGALAVSALLVLLMPRTGAPPEHRTLSPRDGGTPQNILPPRAVRVTIDVDRDAAPPGLYVSLNRPCNRADAIAASHGAYIVKWCALAFVVVAFGRVVYVKLWREIWSVT